MSTSPTNQPPSEEQNATDTEAVNQQIVPAEHVPAMQDQPETLQEQHPYPAFAMYGRFGGPGFSADKYWATRAEAAAGEPVNDLDALFKSHDLAYFDAKSAADIIDADSKLSANASAYAKDSAKPWYDRVVAGLASLYFGGAATTHKALNMLGKDSTQMFRTVTPARTRTGRVIAMQKEHPDAHSVYEDYVRRDRDSNALIIALLMQIRADIAGWKRDLTRENVERNPGPVGRIGYLAVGWGIVDEESNGYVVEVETAVPPPGEDRSVWGNARWLAEHVDEVVSFFEGPIYFGDYRYARYCKLDGERAAVIEADFFDHDPVAFVSEPMPYQGDNFWLHGRVCVTTQERRVSVVTFSCGAMSFEMTPLELGRELCYQALLGGTFIARMQKDAVDWRINLLAINSREVTAHDRRLLDRKLPDFDDDDNPDDGAGAAGDAEPGDVDGAARWHDVAHDVGVAADAPAAADAERRADLAVARQRAVPGGRRLHGRARARANADNANHNNRTDAEIQERSELLFALRNALWQQKRLSPQDTCYEKRLSAFMDKLCKLVDALSNSDIEEWLLCLNSGCEWRRSEICPNVVDENNNGKRGPGTNTGLSIRDIPVSKPSGVLSVKTILDDWATVFGYPTAYVKPQYYNSVTVNQASNGTAQVNSVNVAPPEAIVDPIASYGGTAINNNTQGPAVCWTAQIGAFGDRLVRDTVGEAVELRFAKLSDIPNRGPQTVMTAIQTGFSMSSMWYINQQPDNGLKCVEMYCGLLEQMWFAGLATAAAPLYSSCERYGRYGLGGVSDYSGGGTLALFNATDSQGGGNIQGANWLPAANGLANPQFAIPYTAASYGGLCFFTDAMQLANNPIRSGKPTLLVPPELLNCSGMTYGQVIAALVYAVCQRPLIWPLLTMTDGGANITVSMPFINASPAAGPIDINILLPNTGQTPAAGGTAAPGTFPISTGAGYFAGAAVWTPGVYQPAIGAIAAIPYTPIPAPNGTYNAAMSDNTLANTFVFRPADFYLNFFGGAGVAAPLAFPSRGIFSQLLRTALKVYGQADQFRLAVELTSMRVTRYMAGHAGVNNSCWNDPGGHGSQFVNASAYPAQGYAAWGDLSYDCFGHFLDIQNVVQPMGQYAAAHWQTPRFEFTAANKVAIGLSKTATAMSTNDVDALFDDCGMNSPYWMNGMAMLSRKFACASDTLFAQMQLMARANGLGPWLTNTSAAYTIRKLVSSMSKTSPEAGLGFANIMRAMWCKIHDVRSVKPPDCCDIFGAMRMPSTRWFATYTSEYQFSGVGSAAQNVAYGPCSIGDLYYNLSVDKVPLEYYAPKAVNSLLQWTEEWISKGGKQFNSLDGQWVGLITSDQFSDAVELPRDGSYVERCRIIVQANALAPPCELVTRAGANISAWANNTAYLVVPNTANGIFGGGTQPSQEPANTRWIPDAKSWFWGRFLPTVASPILLAAAYSLANVAIMQGATTLYPSVWSANWDVRSGVFNFGTLVDDTTEALIAFAADDGGVNNREGDGFKRDGTGPSDVAAMTQVNKTGADTEPAAATN
jgi:hypothetical protein